MTTRPRLLLMAMPPSATLQPMQLALERHGLDQQLGSALFKPSNWHQSLSDKYWEDEDPALVDKLIAAGSRLSARTAVLRLNRIAGKNGHWAFKARGKPNTFIGLLLAIRAALATVSISDNTGHSAHVTISYWAPCDLPTLKLVPEIGWLIDRVHLVRGCCDGENYRYEIIKTWKLQPLQGDPQLSLF